MIHDTIARLIRTWVPGAVAWLAGTLGLSAEWSADTTVAVTALIFAGYYALAAFLEERVHPAFGWLLGLPKSRSRC